MNVLFWVSGAIAVICALAVVTRINAMHALIYLVLMFLAIASVFYALGAAFLAVLQIIIYAGAIMVLFVFVVMMINPIPTVIRQERGRISARTWVVPFILAAVLLWQFVSALVGRSTLPAGQPIGAAAVGINLFTTYFIGVEIASILLLAGLVGAFHYGLLPHGQEDTTHG